MLMKYARELEEKEIKMEAMAQWEEAEVEAEKTTKPEKMQDAKSTFFFRLSLEETKSFFAY
jgi:hypothetical protein